MNVSETKLIWFDSVDKRMLALYSAKMNFTFDYRVPEDGEWGKSMGNGNWTGMVGAIQHGTADMTTIVAPNPGRNQIFDHLRAYRMESFAVVSLRPELLAQYNMILRPFNVDVWLLIGLFILIWGAAFWCIQKINSYISEHHSVSLSTSLLYSFSILIENLPDSTPTGTPAQMLVGWWLMAGIVITTAYSSSLVSHLTVQVRNKPVDTWDDILEQENWKWGIFDELLTGVTYNYFRNSRNPKIMRIYKYVEPRPIPDGLQRILQGRYSFLIQTSLITMILASYYTDDSGRTPYYIGKRGQFITSDFGWGVRKGLPFREKILEMMNRLEASGITGQWMQSIRKERVVQNRRQATPEQRVWQQEEILKKIQAYEDENKKVLGVRHMLGIFFIFFSGCGIALLAFLGERLVHRCKPTHDDGQH
ncbi:hypothetical protein SK128_005681 [Halocaridina rubra]|uniref:Ionotropic glutamate receptor C-terminal domain-containing protein n=1 Tax=Halocaridina rubra TaxID=373956 RepID=A0AAN9A3Y0_HALRR